ncbi:MAG: hypothetical protein RLZZ191_1720 [Pseudomonadota bacterium]
MIFELGDIQRFIIRRVHIMHARGKARVHDVEVLVREREVDDEAWLNLVQQSGCRSNIICIKAISVDNDARALLDRNGNRIALRLCPACKADMAEDVLIHGHFVDRNRSHATSANYQYLAHIPFPLIRDSFSGRI